MRGLRLGAVGAASIAAAMLTAASLPVSFASIIGGDKAFLVPKPPRPARRAIYRLRLRGVTYRTNGYREMERRRRQILAGQLTASNGLVISA
jgi:hypothetical protein